MTEFEKATNRFMRRLHEAMENMYIYYDGDKQISKEEFESKFNTEGERLPHIHISRKEINPNESAKESNRKNARLLG